MKTNEEGSTPAKKKKTDESDVAVMKSANKVRARYLQIMSRMQTLWMSIDASPDWEWARNANEITTPLKTEERKLNEAVKGFPLDFANKTSNDIKKRYGKADLIVNCKAMISVLPSILDIVEAEYSTLMRMSACRPPERI